METAVKNLDDIQETDHAPRPSRLGALVLASLGGACIVFASALLLRAPKAAPAPDHDPLAELVARSTAEGPKKDGDIDVTFPRMLSDGDSPTTALEAIDKDGKGAGGIALPPGHPTTPPPALDRLPVFPLPGQTLPAQDILASRGTEASKPKDQLSSLAREASKDKGVEAEPGGPGGYQIQVSSFDKKMDADAFAAVLRRRGHKAYVESANVKGKGVWHRVRIGPFKHKRSADVYRQEFEAKERIVSFIVSPPKTKVALGRADD
jgi:cell division septation protein DedD